MKKLLSLSLGFMLAFSSFTNVYADDTIVEENAQNEVLTLEEVSTEFDGIELDTVGGYADTSDLKMEVDTDDIQQNKLRANETISGIKTGTINEGEIITYDFNSMRYDDGKKNTAFSFFLTDIPTGCDFDLRLVNLTTSQYILLGQNEGNVDEEMYVTFTDDFVKEAYDDDLQIWVVAYQGSGSFTAHANTLWKGRGIDDTIYSAGSYNQSTNLSFNFGSYNSTSPKYSEYQNYYLTNNNAVPYGAIFKSLNIDSSGNGAYWIGLTKQFVLPNGSGLQTANGLSEFNLLDYQPTFKDASGNYYANPISGISVKQNWRIRGFLTRSDYFIWQPKISFSYIYPAYVENVDFLK